MDSSIAKKPNASVDAIGGGSPPATSDFIRAMVAEDLRTAKFGGRVATRFPPEPNGYLHIGHAKSMCLNFGIAEETGGVCHLRFDDTNPSTEDMRYAESIQEDVRWMGFDWGTNLYYASDYFERLYDFAVGLIERGQAYVDSLNDEEIRAYRGTVTEAGRPSPYRDRSVAENLDLFRRMRAGEFDDGSHVLRARIDMSSPNMLMRDPLLYRIRHAHHYRTGDDWCIYPMYDFAHCLSDAVERITHSLCTLEFKDNRELYDWVLAAVDTPRPRPEQTEFARLNLDYTVLSKRKLVELVEGGHVTGWDDPRMPTIAGLRRRGVTPEAIRAFCDMIGVARVDSRVDIEKLEYAVRNDLNQRVPRVMCVLRPLRVVITNFSAGKTEELRAPYYPRDVPKEGSRVIPFARELYIERDDFREQPPKDFFRLAPGREVRLRYAYFIKCVDVVRDPTTGDVVELRCTYDPETRGGGRAPDGRTVKGTIHWVAADHALPAEVRLYDRLFSVPDPDARASDVALTTLLNPESVVTLPDAQIEPSVASDPPGSRYQFERQGYFCRDSGESPSGALVFNRTVGLRDTWAKVAAKATGADTSRPRGRARRSKEGTGTGRERARERAPAAPPNKPAELQARFVHYVDHLGLAPADADILTRDEATATFFEDAVAAHDNPKAVATWVVNDVLREIKDRTIDELRFAGGELGALVALVDDETISRTIAKDVLAELAREGGDPRDIVEREGLEQVGDPGVLKPLVDRVVAAHGDKATQYRAGRTGLLGFFVGQVMRESNGKANPEVVKALVEAALS